MGVPARVGERPPGRVVVRGTEREGGSIAARLQRRDASARGDLFHQEGRRAPGLTYRVLGDGPAAEDAVQETFAQLWERAERLDAANGRIESLLMTIVHRRAVALVRARRRTAPLPEPAFLEPGARVRFPDLTATMIAAARGETGRGNADAESGGVALLGALIAGSTRVASERSTGAGDAGEARTVSVQSTGSSARP